MQRPRLDIKTSALFVSLLLFIHLGAFVVLFFLQIHWLFKLLGTITFFYSLIHCLNRYALGFFTNAIVQLHCCEDNTWLLITRGGESLSALLNNNSVVTKTLALLTFRLEQNQNTILVPLFPGALTTKEFRTLHAYLKSC